LRDVFAEITLKLLSR